MVWQALMLTSFLSARRFIEKDHCSDHMSLDAMRLLNQPNTVRRWDETTQLCASCDGPTRTTGKSSRTTHPSLRPDHPGMGVSSDNFEHVSGKSALQQHSKVQRFHLDLFTRLIDRPRWVVVTRWFLVWQSFASIFVGLLGKCQWHKSSLWTSHNLTDCQELYEDVLGSNTVLSGLNHLSGSLKGVSLASVHVQHDRACIALRFKGYFHKMVGCLVSY